MSENKLHEHRPLFHFSSNDSARPRALDNPTVPGFVTGLQRARGGITELHYFSYYPTDEGLTVFKVGRHENDLEHLTVEILNDKVYGVVYRPHGGAEHFAIRDASDLSKIVQDGKPLVYVSAGKHAQYPVPGPIYRYLGFATEVCRSPSRDKVLCREATPAALHENFGGTVKTISSRLRNLPPVPEVRLREVAKRNLWKLGP